MNADTQPGKLPVNPAGRPLTTEKHADLVFDVGMHKGEDSDFYLKKGFRVVGFEADPDLAAQCRNRFATEIAGGRLVIEEGAILDADAVARSDGTIKFYRNKDKSVWGTVSQDWARRNEQLGTSSEIIEVPVVDFSACLTKHGVPHYLKIDIEGMDMVCLRTLLNIEPKPDYISIESEKISFGKLVGEINLLAQLGYQSFQPVQQFRIADQIEPNPAREGRHVGYRFQLGASGLFGKDLPDQWADFEQTINRYHSIFVGYNLFGDYGTLTRFAPFRFIVKVIAHLTGKPIPGWYDTHARLESE